MKETVVLQKTRPYFARVDCGEPQVFFKFLELDQKRDYVIFAKDGEKILNRFGRDKFPSNVIASPHAAAYFEEEHPSAKLNRLDEFIKAHDAHKFLHIQGDIKPDYRLGKEASGRKMMEKIFAKDKMPSFVSLRNWVEPCYAGIIMADRLKTAQIIIDPQEAHLTSNRYFFYHNDRIGAKYVPLIEYAMLHQAKSAEKTKDFTFGFTVTTDDRVAIYEEIKKIEAQQMNFLVRYPKIDVNTCVKKSEYDKMLEHSRYTLIIPSYEVSDFSAIRFWEALFRDCVPLVHASCKWEQAFVEFPEIAAIIRSALLVNTEHIKSAVGKNYQVILQSIKSTNDWAKLHSIDWYREKTAPFFASL